MLISKAPETRLTIPQIFKINAPPPPPPTAIPAPMKERPKNELRNTLGLLKSGLKLTTCTLIYGMFSLHDKLLAFAI